VGRPPLQPLNQFLQSAKRNHGVLAFAHLNSDRQFWRLNG
jgi:hypothetical protein